MDLKFILLVVRDISFAKVCNQSLVNYTVKKGEGLVSQFRPNRSEIRLALLDEIKETLEYWGLFEEVNHNHMLLKWGETLSERNSRKAYSVIFYITRKINFIPRRI